MAAYYQTSSTRCTSSPATKGGDPPIYYYRRFEQERDWTPWERVPLDITGNHLLAFERNSRLTLAWPVFTIEPETEKPLDTPDPLPAEATPVRTKRRKIQLAVSERAKESGGRRRSPRATSRPVSPKTFRIENEFNFFAWGMVRASR